MWLKVVIEQSCAMIAFHSDCCVWTVLAAGGSVTVLLLVILSMATQRSFKYHGKHVVVTGGSSGIGLDLSKEYAKRGAHVTIVARNKQKLIDAEKAVRDVCKDRNQCINTVSVDISGPFDDVVAKLSSAVASAGTADVIVNCAGTSVAGAFDELAAPDFERMYKVNVLGTVHVTKALLPAMKETGGGRIVFVSSQAAQAALHGYSAYAASKWALRGLAEALQMEVKPYNIFVSVAYPPDTDTPGYEVEMQTKPELTRKISESGSVFKSD